jgi:hypothetical protein
MTREQKRLLRVLSLEMDKYPEIFGRLETGIQAALAPRGINFKFTDEVWQDVLTTRARCEMIIDMLVKGELNGREVS